MEIVIVGSEANREECQLKFGAGHRYTFLASSGYTLAQQTSASVVFDFLSDGTQAHAAYHDFGGIVFLDCTSVTLESRRISNEVSCFGFCGMPGLLNRPLLEVVTNHPGHASRLSSICAELGTSFVAVRDQIGMVTPRVIAMIINEAYLAVEEGIASREDVDLAMKLGTNYPYGPFEWAQRIGVKEVANLLKVLHEHTHDARYKISDLFLREAGLDKG